MLQIFRRFHAAFVDAVSNPFYTFNTVNLPICHGHPEATQSQRPGEQAAELRLSVRALLVKESVSLAAAG